MEDCYKEYKLTQDSTKDDFEEFSECIAFANYVKDMERRMAERVDGDKRYSHYQ